ncbi:MAG: tRNA (adenosine(37)-N6)-threonylcarbamoyltransferase complex dimerization subunit type 1 TsaB [Alkaliphilus sp.]
MKILALDTSSSATTVALLDDEKLVTEYTINNISTHSQKLMSMISEIFKSCGWVPEDIDIFGVSLGPGSFTGLRIGVTTIKAMAQALNKQVYGVSSLDVLAYNLMYVDGIICSAVDAQRDEMYASTYKWDFNKLIQMTEPKILHIDELIAFLMQKNERIYITGDGANKLKLRIEEETKGANIVFPLNALILPRAYAVGNIARLKVLESKNVEDIMPIYMRKSHAECQYEERQLKIEKEKKLVRK